jgi:hypothetical protein
MTSASRDTLYRVVAEEAATSIVQAKTLVNLKAVTKVTGELQGSVSACLADGDRVFRPHLGACFSALAP